jgi:hypothetical protein
MPDKPWVDPAVRGFIDEWLSQQDKCVKTHYPGCYIDRWGRMCGNTGTTVINCNNPPTIVMITRTIITIYGARIGVLSTMLTAFRST